MNFMKEWLKKNGSKILTTLGSIGSVGAIILTVKATLEVDKKIRSMVAEKTEALIKDALEQVPETKEVAVNEKDCYPTKKEIVKECWPCAVPPALVLIFSLGCFWGAEHMNQKQIDALTATCAMLAENFNLWRKETARYVGDGFEDHILKAEEEEVRDALDDNPPWDERQTFYIEGSTNFFETTMEQVIRAEYALNRLFILRGYVTVNDFQELLRQPKVSRGDDLGWDCESGQVSYGYSWIDFTHKHRTLEDGMLVCEIGMPFAPHPMFEAAQEYEEQILHGK